MKKEKILLDTREKKVKFVSIMDRLNVRADLGEGNQVVDARSMIGVMALASGYPIVISIYENDDIANEVVFAIKEFIVD